MSHVLLVDDHPLFRLALCAVISRIQPAVEILEAASLAGAKAIFEGEADIVLVLLDLKMSDSSNFTGLLNLKEMRPNTPIAIVSSSCDEQTIVRAIALGAAGFIPKSTEQSSIIEAVETILSGRVWTPSYSGSARSRKRKSAIFSPMQLKILSGLQRGLRNKEIAKELGISEKTVKAYMSAMFLKLGVDSRMQALVAVQTIGDEA